MTRALAWIVAIAVLAGIMNTAASEGPGALIVLAGIAAWFIHSVASSRAESEGDSP